MWKCWSNAMCVVNNQRHLQTDGERWRTIIGPRRSSAAAAEEKSGCSRPAVLSSCQYFRRQSCSLGLFVSGGKSFLMEWVVVCRNRPGTLLRLIIRRNLPAPGSQKLCFHVNTGQLQAWSHLSLLCLLSIDLDVFQTFQWECLVSQLAGGSGPYFEVGLSRGVKSGSHPEKLPTH